MTGQKTFDFNVDGLAHIGLAPDLVADLKMVGLTDADLDPLLRSAEEYIKVWERAGGQTGVPAQCVDVQTLNPVEMWVGLKSSDDVGTRFDLLAEVFKNGSVIGSGETDNVAGGGSGFTKAILRSTALALSSSGLSFLPGDTLSIRLSVRAGATGHRSGTARLWFNDSTADSRFDGTIKGGTSNYYLLDGFILGTSPGSGPKKTIDVHVDRQVGGNPFKPFGTWSKMF